MTDLTYDITDKDVQWIQERYRTLFNIHIDAETARRELYKLVRQMELVYRPITKQQAKNVNEDNHNDTSQADTK